MNLPERPRVIAVDFDGTLVTHQYSAIGDAVPEAIRVLRLLQDKGCKLILYTMRSGQELQESVQWCQAAGINFWAVNKSPEQQLWTCSPKIYAHCYIDDAAVGAPLIIPKTGRPYVDWLGVENWFRLNKYL